MLNVITCGMQFGDEGKGTFIDYLTDRYKADWIVRYNGGSQAAHTVVTTNGIIHKFSQLGSGFFNDSVNLYISGNMVINLDNLFMEIRELALKVHLSERAIFSRIYFSPACLLVTPYHKLLNRLRELSLGENRRGSVGTGVSEVAYLRYISRRDYKGGEIRKKYGPLYLELGDVFNNWIKSNTKGIIRIFKSLREYVKDFYFDKEAAIKKNMPAQLKEGLERDIQFLLFDETQYEELAKKFVDKCQKTWQEYPDLRNRIVHEMPQFEDVNRLRGTSMYEEAFRHHTIIYEGSQGLLLDGKYGLRPNTTHLDTSIHEAVMMASSFKRCLNHSSEELGRKVITRKIGIAKAFYSRHGEGVFPTESTDLEAIIEDKNQEQTFWNGKIRFGWFDAVLFRYAQRINQVSEVFLSSLDKLNGLEKLKVCNSYIYCGEIDDVFKKHFSFYIDEQGNVIVMDILQSYKNISRYLKQCKPVYITVKGWKKAVFETIGGYRETICEECRDYIRLISSLTNVPITCISYGPTRREKMQI